ncbi:T9SS type A sorting domain-containing protein [Bacteroidota bacterium]
MLKLRLNILQILKSILFIYVFSLIIYAQEWQSNIVYYDNNGKLVYERDEEGNSIPDFSYAGYKNGNDTIPFIPVVKTISPIEGDNSSHIKNAIFDLALNNPPDANGFRGALLLEAGIYEIHGTLEIKNSGVVLRGVGDGDNPDSNTIIYGKSNSPSKRTIMVVGGGSNTEWEDQVSGTKTNILSDTILVGENTFDVENASRFSIGDNIIVYHPCTQEWLETIDFGGTHSEDPGAEPGVDLPWSVDSQPIVYNRYITDIDSNKITVDVPFFNHLIRELSQSYIYKYSRSGLRYNIGIENLRVDIETENLVNDEDHAWTAIDFGLVEDAWVRDCTALHFYRSGFRTYSATRVTIENCIAIDPVSEIDGGRRYNFNTYRASQQILFKNCTATKGRHSYVSNGISTTSGIVFYNCTSSDAYAASEGHRQWTQGMLYDNHVELDGPRPGYNPRLLAFYNRGYYGTSHGWAAIHSVAWNCDVKEGHLTVQKPPTGQNYAIGCSGGLVDGYGQSTFEEPAGYIEGTGQAGLNPQSLYMAQYLERQNSIVSVKSKNIDNIPSDFVVFQNFPNPFNLSTTVKIQLPEIAKVKVTIVDILGRTLNTLSDGYLDKGINFLKWNGIDESGHTVSSGIYFSVIESKYGLYINKMMLLK